MRLLATTVIAAILMLSGCSKPTDAVIPSDVDSWDEKLAPEIKKLSDADREKVAAYLMRVKMGEVFGGGGIPTGMTIGQAIEAQSKWENEQAAKRAEEEALKKKLEQERAAALEQLNKAVTVTLLAKRELPKNYNIGRYSEYQEFRIGAQNNTERPIVGVSGEIKFIDVFDKEIGAVNFRISESIEPGKTVVWTGGRDYNQFIDSHRAVWNLEDGKYTTKFVPEMIVFSDGEKLAVPE
ncbi:hypothetical protein DFR36_106187 [Melaminivora alkalimesophila]|uniref:Lipoprotein n=1 Tax=Melaminivora alkalimesophila TaxID=1165852 RepID=A0A317RCE6_9BURK|nr:hypothetical protein [Melaminivora alkalimesophila]PWW45697.1 hypothetical protein DFR36_106187 [Melaminivora alkalimesophila]